MNDQEMYTFPKAAKVFGVTTRTLLNWKERGWLTTIKLPNGHHRITQSEIDRILSEVNA